MIISKSDRVIDWLSDIEKIPTVRKRYKITEPYVCTECDKVWQGDGWRMVDYLVDFPRTGCTPKICFHCKEDHR